MPGIIGYGDRSWVRWIVYSPCYTANDRAYQVARLGYLRFMIEDNDGSCSIVSVEHVDDCDVLKKSAQESTGVDGHYAVTVLMPHASTFEANLLNRSYLCGLCHISRAIWVGGVRVWLNLHQMAPLSELTAVPKPSEGQASQ